MQDVLINDGGGYYRRHLSNIIIIMDVFIYFV